VRLRTHCRRTQRYGRQSYIVMRSYARSWGTKGKEARVAKVIERVEARYEIQDVEMGKVYKWCPANVLVECTCGEEPTLSAFRTTCGECGADHVAFVGDLLDARLEDKGDHPWRYLQPYTPTRGI
jgi:hypothetical protein